MTDQHTLGIRAEFDRQLIRDSGESVRYLVVWITAPTEKQDAVEHARPPMNLSLVLDASYSMSGRPLEAAKHAAAGVIKSLSERDTVSVISFAAGVRTHVDRARLNPSATARALASIHTITSRPMTNLSAGWLRGVECAARVMEELPGCHNHVILLSDGYANRGITDPAELQHQTGRWCSRRIFTSTVGIGNDYSPEQLQVLAEFGGGRMHDAEQLEEIAEVLIGELSELTDTRVESASISLSLPPGVQVENLSRFPTIVTCTRVVTQIGSLRADASRAVVFKITAPAGPVGDSLSFEVATTWTWPGDPTPISARSIAQSLTYAHSNESSAQRRNSEVRLLVARTWQATVVRQAAELNRSRQTGAAERYLDGQLKFFPGYCHDLPGSEHLIEELEEMRRVVGLEWSERGRKEMELASYKLVRNETDQRRTSRLGWSSFLPK